MTLDQIQSLALLLLTEVPNLILIEFKYASN